MPKEPDLLRNQPRANQRLTEEQLNVAEALGNLIAANFQSRPLSKTPIQGSAVIPESATGGSRHLRKLK